MNGKTCLTGGSLLTLLLLIAARAFPAASALAQGSPISPKISIQGDQKRLTPEEQERQKKLDEDYKAASKKRSEGVGPLGDVRPAPSASASKKKQQ
jgi:hypothetical protein